MSGNVVAKAWVEIIPEMSGIRGKVSKELGGVDGEAAKAGKSSGKSFGSGFSGAAKAGFAALGGAVAAIGIGELAAQAAETASVMSRLSASAEQNGVSVQSMDAAFDGLVGVLGDTDRAVEASGNMFALCGDNQAQLESLTTALAGAYSQFGDGLPIEGLAEAANETAKCGQVTGSFADALNWVSASAEQWDAALSGNKAAQDAFNAAIEGGATKEDAFSQALAACSDEGERNQLVTDTLNALYGEAGEKYQEANADLIAYNKSQQALTEALGSLGEAFMPAVTAAQNFAADALEAIAPVVGEVVGQVTGAAGGMMERLAPLMEQFQTTVMPVVQSLAESLGGAFALIMPVVEQMLGTIMRVGEALAPMIQQVVDFALGTVLPIVIPAIQAILATVETVLPLIQAIWSAVWPVLQAVVTPIMQGISTFIQGAMTAIQGVINIVLGIINGDWSQVWEGIQQLADGVWTAISGIVDAAIGAVWGFISSTLSTIQEAWNSAWEGVKSFLGDTWEGIKKAASEGVDKVFETVTGIKDDILEFFSNAGQWLWDAGESIINGLKDGIMNAVGSVTNAVSGAVQSIRNLFPFSPAKEGPFSGHGYTTWSGRALMGDWGKGISDAAPEAVDFAERAAASVRAALSEASGASFSVRPRLEVGGAGDDGAAELLRRAVDLLEALAAKDTDVYMDGAKVSAALTGRAKVTAAGRGRALCAV